MLPLIYCAFFDYATGDDLGYGSVARHILMENDGIGAFFSVIVKQVVRYWHTYQGTWSSVFLFSLQPGIWGERFYSITPFLAMLCIIGGTGILLYELMVKKGGILRNGFIATWMIACLFMIQYMPTIRGGMFWYTSVAHYTIPYGVTCASLVSVLRFMECGGRIRYAWILLAYFYLGGGGYPAIVISLFATVVVIALFLLPDGLLKLRETKDAVARKRAWLIMIPFLINLIGFGVSAVAPGNKARGGEDFGFGMGRAFGTILMALKEGVAGSLGNFIRVRPLFLLIPFVVLITLELVDETDENNIKWYRHPVLAVAFSYLMISAVYTPQIYAGVEVSGGVPDTIFFVLVVMVAWCSSYLAGWWKTTVFRKRLESGHDTAEEFRLRFYKRLQRIRNGFLVFVVLFVVGAWRFLIGNTADYMCVEFIRSGGLRDFRAQMQERLEILEDDSVMDVVLPQMNDYQGPFMHMPVTDNPGAYTNSVVKDYYGKNSVIAIPRDEWYRLYKGIGKDQN